MPDAYSQSVKIRGILDTLQFLSFIEEFEVEKAIEFSQTHLSLYLNEKQRSMIPAISPLTNTTCEFNIVNLTALLCYADPS